MTDLRSQLAKQKRYDALFVNSTIGAFLHISTLIFFSTALSKLGYKDNVGGIVENVKSLSTILEGLRSFDLTPLLNNKTAVIYFFIYLFVIIIIAYLFSLLAWK